MLFREFQNLCEEDKRSASRGDRSGKMTNANQRNDGDISWEETNTRVVPIQNPVMMDKRLNRGELLVEVQEKFMYTEENTMDDVREPYMMAVTCTTGGHQNILRYAGTIEEEADETPAARRDDVCVQVLVDEGGGDDTVPVDDSGGAAPV